MNPEPAVESAARAEGYPRPARKAAVAYTKFRDEHGIKSGEGLTFYQWLDFADAYAASERSRVIASLDRAKLAEVIYEARTRKSWMDLDWIGLLEADKRKWLKVADAVAAWLREQEGSR